MATKAAVALPSWTDIQSTVAKTPVGKTLNDEAELRTQGKGSAHVQSKLRLFESSFTTKEKPPIILYRDHAGKQSRLLRLLVVGNTQKSLKLLLSSNISSHLFVKQKDGVLTVKKQCY
jgi:hypothetical protein